ncbi:MAG: phosphoglucomutase/phosphomannomutase family protein [Armatimonadota bacterium]
MSIKFGTDGWRAVIADEYTFENVKVCSNALSDYLLDKNRKKLEIYKNYKGSSFKNIYQDASKGIVIGYDARFLSGSFAKTTADILSSYNIPVYLSDKIAPTPAISWFLKKNKCAGGVVITASHNPPEYNGFKFKAEYGGSGLPQIMCGIEKKINYKKSTDRKPDYNKIKSSDLITPYINQLKNFVDLTKISKLKIKVVVDCMYGATTGLFEKLFKNSKNVKIISIRDTYNPGFDGINPEPLDKNLVPLKEAVIKNKADIGFAFDGDGDRIGAYDKHGNFLSSHHIFLILLHHLVKNRGMKGKIVKTFSTTEKVRLLAEELKLGFIETPIGFKYICDLMLKDNVLIGGEESGGIGIKGHMPERDALACALLMLEAVSCEKSGIHTIMNNIYKKVGEFAYERVDLKLKSFKSKDKIINKLKNNPPKVFCGIKIESVKTLDGVKYLFKDNSWILFRPSGTEPLLRIYAETKNRKKSLQLLDEAVKSVKKEE